MFRLIEIMLKFRIKTVLFAGVLVAALGVMATAPRAAELLMFEADYCEWCEVWNEEIGPIYPKTAEAKCAPLRRLDISEALPPDLEGVKPVRFTPTFVLVEDGREVGRVLGYAGEDFFWGLLDEQFEKLSVPCVG